MAFAFIPIILSLALRLVEVGRLVQENRGGRSDFQGQRGVSWAERGQGHRQSDLPLKPILRKRRAYGTNGAFPRNGENRNLQGQGWEQEDPHESGWRTVDSGGSYQSFFSRMIRANCSLNRRSKNRSPDHNVMPRLLRCPYYEKGPLEAITHSTYRRRFSERSCLPGTIFTLGPPS